MSTRKCVIVTDERMGMFPDGAIYSRTAITGGMRELLDYPGSEFVLVSRPCAAGQRNYVYVPKRRVKVSNVPDWSRGEFVRRFPSVIRAVGPAIRVSEVVVVFGPSLGGLVALFVSALLGRRESVLLVLRSATDAASHMYAASSRLRRLSIAIFSALWRICAVAFPNTTCVSKFLAESVGRGGVSVAPEVDWQELDRVASEVDGERFGLLFVGRLEAEKNAELAIRTALVDPTRSERLRIVGDGSQRVALETLVGSLGGSSVVEFSGIEDRDVVLSSMKRARVVLVPSISEGFGLVALEAIACGAQVAYSPVGGIPEAVGWSDSAAPVSSRDPNGWFDVVQLLRTRPARVWPGSEKVQQMNGWTTLVSLYAQMIERGE